MNKILKTSLLLLTSAAFVNAQSSDKKNKNNREVNVKKQSVAADVVSPEERRRIDLAIQRSLNDQKALEEEQKNIDTAIAKSLQDQKEKEAAEAKDRLTQALERARDSKKKAESTLERDFRAKKQELLPMRRSMEIDTKEPKQDKKPTGKVEKVPFKTQADKAREEEAKRSNSPDGGEVADSTALPKPKVKAGDLEEFDVVDKSDAPSASAADAQPPKPSGSFWNPFNWFKK